MSKETRLLKAVNHAASRLASIEDLDVVLRDVLSICIEAVEAEGGTIYMHEPAKRRLTFKHVLPEVVADRLERLDIPDNFGAAGEVFHTRRSRISEFPNATIKTRTDLERKAGVTVHSMLTIPLQVTGMAPIGVIQLVNKQDGQFDETDVQLLDTVSDICAVAVMNSRLLERRSQVAALEGMGRAAHDLANKAGVLVTFLPEFERNLKGLEDALKSAGNTGDAWLYLKLLCGTFEDVFAPYSDRVYRYARLINDLAAGKPLLPKKKMGNFGVIIREAAEFMEPQAREARAKIVYDLNPNAPEFEFDDLFIMRIVENILGNAIKAVKDATPEEWLAEHPDRDDTYGEIKVTHTYANGKHLMEIQDNGPGMSPSTIRDILEGSARSSWMHSSGTGIGTKVVVELAAVHDAVLSIDSRLGHGSKFAMEFPGYGEKNISAVSDKKESPSMSTSTVK